MIAAGPEAPGLTLHAWRALAIAHAAGAVVAGYQIERGSRTRVQASTIQSLARQGLVTLDISPDGGMQGRLTEAGRAAIAAQAVPS